MNKKSITILVVCLIVTIMSVSLAYYTTRIIGDGKNVSVNAKELTINFDNNNEIAEGIIEPGWSSTNTFSVENKSKSTFTYDIVLKNYKNTTKTNGYLVYKITSTNGYNMTEYKDMPKDGDNTYDLVIARGITIEPGSSNKQSYSLEIKYLDSDRDQSIDMGETVTGSLYIVESTTNQDNPYTEGTLGYQIMEDNSNIKTRTDFSKVYEDINIGTMYKATEDNTDVYYFAGDARNNWVKFGTWKEDKTIIIGYNANNLFYTFDTLEKCNADTNWNTNCHELKLASAGDPMYWRIIRTNKDGSVRLLYAGTSVSSTTAFIDTSYFNSDVHNPAHVGYMYGANTTLETARENTTSSDIKNVIDNWYQNNLTNYTKYLSTSAVYCNDRNTTGNTQYSTTEHFVYDTFNRIQGQVSDGLVPTSYVIQPTYDCNNVKDAFSVDNENAKLTYPVALITADEIVYAGGKYGEGASAWYSFNSKLGDALGIDKSSKIEWWTMSPYYFGGSSNYNYVYSIENKSYGNILGWGSYLTFRQAVRPVLSVTGDNLWKSGDGTAENPYEIVTE